MKMVAVCKLRAAQEHLDAARDFAAAFDTGETVTVEDFKKPVYIGITADKGLCGAINSSVVRAVRNLIIEHGDKATEGSIFTVGEKGKQGLERAYGKMFRTTVAEPGGMINPTFKQVGVLADYWLSIEHDATFVYYQKFKSMISYETTLETFAAMDPATFADYEMEGDTDILTNFQEFRCAVKLYYFLAENESSMLSARMNAMDNSSKNAGEMIDKLELLMNRTRQAKITTELTEIISGASAVE